MSTKGIPTVYQHMRFRSRLEAKWAKFFDLCGWRWSYEPFDLDGWIPDFAIGDRLQTLVEIKPIMSLTETSEQMWTKIERAIDDGRRVIVLGADPTQWLDGRPSEGCPCVGWEIGNGDLHFGWTEGNAKPGLCCMDGGWRNCVWLFTEEHGTHPNKLSRVSGWGNSWSVPMDAWTMLVRYWREACNSTQWMRGNDGN